VGIYVRVYTKFEDIKEIKKHLIVMDELYGKCENCGYIGIEIGDISKCPKCSTDFKYVAFRVSKGSSLWSKIKKLNDKFNVIDYEDYLFWMNKQKAYDIFK
jgi:uncharacterized protein (UPF0212 family)